MNRNKDALPSIQIIPCGQDNCIYLLACGNGQCVVIDPGLPGPVLSVLEKQKLTLTHILLTHHHGDHTAGAGQLKSKFNCRIIGPDSQRILGLDEIVKDNQTLKFGDLSIQVLATPGHTRTSVCYIVELHSGNPSAVFTGDTLFIGGCGRLLEGPAQQMYQSLMKLAALPDQTRVYPGHDYTAENYRFALTVEPDNGMVKKQLSEIETKGSWSVIPSTIGLEKQTNPFLRTRSVEIRETLQMPNASESDVFERLRNMKDVF